MFRQRQWLRKGYGVLFGLMLTALLSGCITVDCKDCTKCGDPGAPCAKHQAAPGEKGCTSGYVCNVEGATGCMSRGGGTCTTVNNGGACNCNCM